MKRIVSFLTVTFFLFSQVASTEAAFLFDPPQNSGGENNPPIFVADYSAQSRLRTESGRTASDGGRSLIQSLREALTGAPVTPAQETERFAEALKQTASDGGTKFLPPMSDPMSFTGWKEVTLPSAPHSPDDVAKLLDDLKVRFVLNEWPLTEKQRGEKGVVPSQKKGNLIVVGPDLRSLLATGIPTDRSSFSSGFGEQYGKIYDSDGTIKLTYQTLRVYEHPNVPYRIARIDGFVLPTDDKRNISYPMEGKYKFEQERSPLVSLDLSRDKAIARVLSTLRDRNVQKVTLLLSGATGDLKEVTYDVSTLQQRLQFKKALEGSPVVPLMKRQARTLLTSTPNTPYFAAPDPYTLMVDPFDDSRMMMMAEVVTEDGKPFENDARYRMRQFLQKAWQEGRFIPVVGLEPEWFLITRDEEGNPLPTDLNLYYDRFQDHPVEVQQILLEAINALLATGISMVNTTSEVAGSQHEWVIEAKFPPKEIDPALIGQELPFKYLSALRTLDDFMLYKFLLKKTAKRHGKEITFEAKPFKGVNGSGMHHHVSISQVDENGTVRNLFSDPANPVELSRVGQAAAEGVMRAGRETFGLIIPSPADMARHVRKFEAPVLTGYISEQNRSAAIRRPKTTFAKGVRFEYRVPAPDSNMYVSAGVILSSVFYGVRNSLTMRKPVVGKSLYKMEEENPAELLEHLPEEIQEKVRTGQMTLEQALETAKVPETFEQAIQIAEASRQTGLVKEVVAQGFLTDGMTREILRQKRLQLARPVREPFPWDEAIVKAGLVTDDGSSHDGGTQLAAQDGGRKEGSLSAQVNVLRSQLQLFNQSRAAAEQKHNKLKVIWLDRKIRRAYRQLSELRMRRIFELRDQLARTISMQLLVEQRGTSLEAAVIGSDMQRESEAIHRELAELESEAGLTESDFWDRWAARDGAARIDERALQIGVEVAIQEAKEGAGWDELLALSRSDPFGDLLDALNRQFGPGIAFDEATRQKLLGLRDDEEAYRVAVLESVRTQLAARDGGLKVGKLVVDLGEGRLGRVVDIRKSAYANLIRNVTVQFPGNPVETKVYPVVERLTVVEKGGDFSVGGWAVSLKEEKLGSVTNVEPDRKGKAQKVTVTYLDGSVVTYAKPYKELAGIPAAARDGAERRAIVRNVQEAIVQASRKDLRPEMISENQTLKELGISGSLTSSLEIERLNTLLRQKFSGLGLGGKLAGLNPDFTHYVLIEQSRVGEIISWINEGVDQGEISVNHRIAINGAGRIGMNLLRAWLQNPEGREIVAINDIAFKLEKFGVEALKDYVSVLRDEFEASPRSKVQDVVIEYGKDDQGAYPYWISFDGRRVTVTDNPDPAKLPWSDLDIDFALEATGVFLTREAAEKHHQAGARHVIITAPVKGNLQTIAPGVNHDTVNPEGVVYSCASCTTNAIAPPLKVIQDTFGIEEFYMDTTHAYTADQSLLDTLRPGKQLRGRAAAVSIVPSSTGAASAIGEVIPELAGKGHGIALRVPVPNGSIVGVQMLVSKPTTKEEVNRVLKAAAEGPLKGRMAYKERDLVSKSILGRSESSIIDGTLTHVGKSGRLVTVWAWYDNEFGYANRVLDLASIIGGAEATREAAKDGGTAVAEQLITQQAKAALLETMYRENPAARMILNPDSPIYRALSRQSDTIYVVQGDLLPTASTQAAFKIILSLLEGQERINQVWLVTETPAALKPLAEGRPFVSVLTPDEYRAELDLKAKATPLVTVGFKGQEEKLAVQKLDVAVDALKAGQEPNVLVIMGKALASDPALAVIAVQLQESVRGIESAMIISPTPLYVEAVTRYSQL